MKSENIERSHVRGIQLVAHEFQCSHAGRLVDHHLALFVDDPPTKRAEVLDESGNETFVARALPDDAISWSTATSHRSPGIGNDFLQRLRLVLDEVGAPVQESDVR